MKARRFLALLMAAIMIVATGCALSEGSSERDKVTMLVAARYVADYDTNLLSLMVEEAANVDIEFIVVPRDEIAQKLSLMVNGGSDLPDMISTCADKLPSSYEYGTAGIYLALNDYFNDPEKMPNFNNNVKEEDKAVMLGSVVQPDGKVYSATWYYPSTAKPTYTMAFINQDWLDALGMEIPTTTEEFYEVLKAFKENDPNGNGTADEIPAIASTKGEYGIAYCMSPFIYVNRSGVDYVNVDENGNVYAAYTTDEWRQGLEYLTKLVAEELFVSVSFTEDNSEFNAIIQSQPVGVYFSGLYDNIPDALVNYQPLPTLTGPNGENYVFLPSQMASETFAIFADTDNVDACIRVLDAFYDREISAHANRGQRGVDWTTEVPEGYVLHTEIPGVDKPGYTTLIPQWGVKENTQMWMNYCPGYLAADDPWSGDHAGYPADENSTDYSSLNITMTAKVKMLQLETGTALENQLRRVVLDEDQQTEFNDLKAQIDTYVKESIVRFATGDMALSEWDNYIKTLEGMGNERYIELIQIGYDNYANVVK